MAEYNTRIKMKRDTSANWTSNDPVLLNGEIIIVDTAAGDVRRKVGDGTKRYSQLPFDDESILSKIDESSEASVAVNAILSAASWADGRQTLSITGMTARANGVIGLAQNVTAEQFEAATLAGLYMCGQADGTITVACSGTVPTCDIPVVVIRIRGTVYNIIV